MIFYILLILFPLVFSFFSYTNDDGFKKFCWLATCIFLVFFIGLRDEIGVDWEAYKKHLDITVNESVFEIITTTDPAYAILNWIVALFGGNVYIVNLICSLFFVFGLYKFCIAQKMPWIAYIISIPVLILVVGMSYTRQSVAVGFEFLALIALSKAEIRKFVIYILIGVLFHKSSLFLLCLLAFVSNKNKLLMFLGVIFLIILIVLLLVVQQYEALFDLYLEQKLTSDGGLFRLALNIIPALLILLFIRKYSESKEEHNIWLTLSILSFLLFPLIQIAPTATDRLFIYFIPVQMFAYSNFPYYLNNKGLKFVSLSLIVIATAIFMFTWLLFGTYRDYWVPYKNILF